MEIVQEITLEKGRFFLDSASNSRKLRRRFGVLGLLFKILIISSEVKSQVYIIKGEMNAENVCDVAWKVEESIWCAP